MFTWKDGWEREKNRIEYLELQHKHLQALAPQGTTLLLHTCGTYTVATPQSNTASVIDISMIDEQGKQINLTDEIASLLELAQEKAQETGKRGLCWHGVPHRWNDTTPSSETSIDEEFTRYAAQAIWDDPHAYTHRLLPEWHGYNANFLDQTWCGIDWSPWVPFSRTSVGINSLPDRRGIYRIKETGVRELFYIGFTISRSLRLYLAGLYRAAFHDPNQMPYRVASLLEYPSAPALWAWHDTNGRSFECSAAAIEEDHQVIRGLTHCLLWIYRHEMRSSPSANFGRFHAQYTAPVIFKDRKYIRGGKLLDGEVNPASGPSYQPVGTVPFKMKIVSDTYWMLLRWSGTYDLNPQSVRFDGQKPPVTGVYVITNTSWELLNIGWSRDIYQTIQEEATNTILYREGARLRYFPLKSDTPNYQLDEIVNDLIGGYFSVTRKMPLYLF